MLAFGRYKVFKMNNTFALVCLCACVLVGGIPLERQDRLSKAMAKRSSSSSDALPESKRLKVTKLTDDERAELRRDLVASARGTKRSIAYVLQKLHDKNLLLDDDLGASKNERKKLAKSAAIHANADTPYGKVVQSMRLPLEGESEPYALEFIHPFAFIWYLSSVCAEFSAIMMASVVAAANHSLSLLLYGDELTPGNPLRADLGRQALNFYYCFVEWPNWLLHRKDGWLCLCSLRSTLVHRILGGAALLVKRLLFMLFVQGNTNLRTGVTFMHNGSTVFYTARFKGFLADEKGLKEFYDIKGQAGFKCCISCQNVVNFLHKKSAAEQERQTYAIPLDIDDFDKLKIHDNASFYEMVDLLEEAHTALETAKEAGERFGHLAKALKDLEYKCGINYNEDSFLFCRTLRGTVIQPVDNYFRDWQHTLASSGVAGTEIACVLTVLQKNKTLKAQNITLDTVLDYCTKFTLPSGHGKFNENWFKSKFLAKDHVKHFASDVLGMVPLLASFLVTVIVPTGEMLEHSACMSLLRDMLFFMSSTYDMTLEAYTHIRQLVNAHHKLFRKLYRAFTKIKFHHLFHLPEDFQRMGAILSCFVTERKHRDWKAVSLYAFANVEHQSTYYSVQEFTSGRFQFAEEYLHEPRDASYGEGEDFKFASHATLRVGELRVKDVVVAKKASRTYVGEISNFFEIDGAVFVAVQIYKPLNDSCVNDFDVVGCHRILVEGTSIRAKCAWAHRRKGVVHVLLPSFSLL